MAELTEEEKRRIVGDEVARAFHALLAHQASTPEEAGRMAADSAFERAVQKLAEKGRKNDPD